MNENEIRLKCLDIIYQHSQTLSALKAVDEAKILSEYVTSCNHVQSDNTPHKG